MSSRFAFQRLCDSEAVANGGTMEPPGPKVDPKLTLNNPSQSQIPGKRSLCPVMLKSKQKIATKARLKIVKECSVFLDIANKV